MELYSALSLSNLKSALQELLKLLNIEVIASLEAKKVCNNNITMLNEIDKYEVLYKTVEKHISIVKELNLMAKQEALFNTENELKVLATERFFSEKISKDRSTIRPYLKTFELMEFYKIEKIDTMNYYQILKITEEKLIKAEEIAKIMKTNKLNMSKMNKRNIEKYFSSYLINVKEI